MNTVPLKEKMVCKSYRMDVKRDLFQTFICAHSIEKDNFYKFFGAHIQHTKM